MEFCYNQDMTKEKFEEIVREGIKAIPKKFLEKLNNVNICIEDNPTSYQLGKLKNKEGFLLFGLYEGIPQTERRRYSQALPDKITIFKKPIEQVAKSEKKIKEIVKNTVWHEIAHHFGMNEEEIQMIEKKRRKK